MQDGVIIKYTTAQQFTIAEEECFKVSDHMLSVPLRQRVEEHADLYLLIRNLKNVTPSKCFVECRDGAPPGPVETLA